MENRIIVLSWEKVALVVPEREDAKIWYEQINDLENQKFLNLSWTICKIEDEYDYYQSLSKKSDQKTFCVMILKNKKIIWNISLFSVCQKNRNAILWVLIWDKTEQNKWYWSEAIMLMLRYWFEVLGLHKIKLQVLEINNRAKKVYEKIGFQVSWVLKDEIFDGEKYFDEIHMEIFRKDFFEKNKK